MVIGIYVCIIYANQVIIILNHVHMFRRATCHRSEGIMNVGKNQKFQSKGLTE